MRFMVLLLALLCFGISTELARASIYDSKVIQHLQLTGAQRQAMQRSLNARSDHSGSLA
jgi:hypothetical protein